MPEGNQWDDGWLRVVNITEEIKDNNFSDKMLSHHARKQLSLKPHLISLKAATRPAPPLAPSTLGEETLTPAGSLISTVNGQNINYNNDHCQNLKD